jgi:hypothetical protein
MGRLIDGDALIDKYGEWYTEEGTEAGYIGTIKGIVDSMPTIEPEPKWKRLMMHLADLQLTYSPNWGANGCGDQKLYEFVTGLIDELQGWEEGE